ncbi:MAG: hypothetical protein M3174_05755 [Actinomycetota bacterium]|nr:hypothetical protein [Actinomycetota bacterium]
MGTRAGLVALAACLLAATGVSLPVETTDAAPRTEGCGLTTLDGTIKYSAKIRERGNPLECGPAQKIVVRKLTRAGRAGRHQRQQQMITFFSIADVQLADEEAPARAEWSDKCEQTPFGGSGFRPHETMVPHLLNAHLRAASKIARRGGPVTDDEFDFAVGLGDLADNMQYNEIRWIIDLFDGRKIVNPDSGDGEAGDDYDGVQKKDPKGAPTRPVDSPVDGQRIVDLANEPFWAHGLRHDDGRLPWYTLPGNHDVKPQGTSPNEPAWNAFLNEYNQGPHKIKEPLSPEEQQRACDGDYGDPDFYRDIFSNPNLNQIVPPDEDRRMFIDRNEWALEHFETTGKPDGHGYNENRCTNKNGELLHRLCYSFDKGLFHFIGLDSNPDEGLETGNIDHPQWRWLKRELKANSRFYYNAKREPVVNPDARNRFIVLFAHHPVQSMRNEETENGHTGREFVRLLKRFPNVILNANGHTHQNKIWARRSRKPGGSYWEVNTSAIADYPTQSRTIEIVNNHDGTISIFAVVFNADVDPNVRHIDWKEDDPTSEEEHAHEHDHGHEYDVNEDWLASFGQEVLFYDPQQDLTEIGAPTDRNVELLLRAPRWFRRR